MRSRVILRLVFAPLLLLACVAGTLAVAQSGLSPAVEADLLKNQVVTAYSTHDTRKVLALIDRYHALEAKGIKIPVPLLFLEAKAAASLGQTSRALTVLTTYLNEASHDDPSYKQALDLYPAYQQANEASVQEENQRPPAAKVLAAIANGDVKTIQTFLAAGWNPAQPLDANSVEARRYFAKGGTVVPISFALQGGYLSVVPLLLPGIDLSTFDFRSDSGQPAWLALSSDCCNKDADLAASVLEAFVKSRTPLTTSDDSLLLRVYGGWKIDSQKRHKLLFEGGRLSSKDFAGALGPRLLIAAVRRGSVPELQAMLAYEIPLSSFYTQPDSLQRLLLGETCTLEYPEVCMQSSAPAAANLNALVGAGWKPDEEKVQEFWKTVLFQSGEYGKKGVCNFHTAPSVLLIPIYDTGVGFEKSWLPVNGLIEVALLRPNQKVVATLQSKVDRYAHGFAGKKVSGTQYGPTRATACGQLLGKLGGTIKD